MHNYCLILTQYHQVPTIAVPDPDLVCQHFFYILVCQYDLHCLLTHNQVFHLRRPQLLRRASSSSREVTQADQRSRQLRSSLLLKEPAPHQTCRLIGSLTPPSWLLSHKPRSQSAVGTQSRARHGRPHASSSTRSTNAGTTQGWEAWPWQEVILPLQDSTMLESFSLEAINATTKGRVNS